MGKSDASVVVPVSKEAQETPPCGERGLDGGREVWSWFSSFQQAVSKPGGVNCISALLSFFLKKYFVLFVFYLMQTGVKFTEFIHGFCGPGPCLAESIICPLQRRSRSFP